MMRLATTLLVLPALAGCGMGDLLGNEGFEIDCDGKPCDWKLIEGDADLTASWHDGDAGADLSGAGRAVIEQRSAPFEIPTRELVLGAAIARDGASIRFEIDWYVAGSGEGATYWDRAPILVDTRGFDVEERGVFALEELLSTPSREVSGLALRVVKEGEGIAMIDEVSLTEPVVVEETP
ncbi:MAG TPA: hypothetical protein VFU21_26660 [Kofleriaceae bacterium]|nr:hypothetical protein [Kofleriaceae bacterium]